MKTNTKTLWGLIPKSVLLFTQTREDHISAQLKSPQGITPGLVTFQWWSKSARCHVWGRGGGGGGGRRVGEKGRDIIHGSFDDFKSVLSCLSVVPSVPEYGVSSDKSSSVRFCLFHCLTSS